LAVAEPTDIFLLMSFCYLLSLWGETQWWVLLVAGAAEYANDIWKVKPCPVL
jgi:hypothetical protein